MPLILDVLVALGLASAFAGAVRLWRRSLASGRLEDMQALAARRGWSLNVTGARLDREGTLRLGSRGGHAWTVEVRRERGAGAVTEYLADSPRWADGTLIATLAAAEEQRALPRAIGADLARAGASMTRLPVVDGMLLLSDSDPARRAILQDLARALRGWAGPGSPVLVLSPEGLRLRLPAPVERADRMERFVDLAFDLSRVIGP